MGRNTLVTMATKRRKYTPDVLLPALRLFVKARKKALAGGFTDNGGAIHSIERIIDILSQILCYPHLTHINKLKDFSGAEMSQGARRALKAGRRTDVLIEHIMPQRAFALELIALIENGCTDRKLCSYIKRHYRLVLLDKEETARMNKLNRSKISKDRLLEAGIKLHQPKVRT